MSLIALDDIEVGFGGEPLLDGIALRLEAGERVCLLGRNGAGKSTLLDVVAGARVPDSGARRMDDSLRIGFLPQSVPATLAGSVREVVAGALAEVFDWITRCESLGELGDPAALAELHRLQMRIESVDGWHAERRVERTLSGLALESAAPFRSLSGGQQRRVLLARALVIEPQLLILDEPTNHLDIAAIEWLTELLMQRQGAVLFTTHDRRLLRDLATRIVEIDRGALTSWPGDYDNYLRRRDERLAAEDAQATRDDKRLAEEEIWIRQGIKARRTRNEGRVRRLEAMREARAERKQRAGTARISVNAAGASGKRVVEATEVAFSYPQAGPSTPVVEGFSVLIERGDRVGLIGPNGAGKTTVLRLLLGQLAPSAGSIEIGTRVEVAYFDQSRAELDDAMTVRDAVADGADRIDGPGGSRHVISYLQDFLFAPNRANVPVRALSGGERARLLLARLFATPSNVLVLDEPTNDLDLETLELLEEQLLEYPGTLLVVSHDREFLDNVVTSTLVLEGDGRVREYVGGYSDWLRQRPAAVAGGVQDGGLSGAARRSARTGTTVGLGLAPGPASEPGRGGDASARRATQAKARPSFKERRELETLPADIEALERRLAELQATLADPSLYREQPERVAELRDALAETERAMETMFERWSDLETRFGTG